MNEREDGGRGIVESEVKVCQPALSKHHCGGFGSGAYKVGDRTGKWSRSDQWKSK